MGPIKLVAREPGGFKDQELDDFMAFVVAGGEVTLDGLEQRIRSAARLVFLYLGCCLSGIAALKRPESAHRRSTSSKSKVPLAEADFPYELGYIFVIPSARRRGFSLDLAREALTVAGAAGVFATSRTDNNPMHATLSKLGFAAEGSDYPSIRKPHRIRLFLRRSAKQGAVPVSAKPIKRFFGAGI